MLRILLGAALGAGTTFAAVQYFTPTKIQMLDYEQQQMVNSYISNHHLEKLLKQSIMNGYMALNKAFLDYGVKIKLDGFYFYGTYFEASQMQHNKISRAHCIFSPRDQLCGHPNIMHGGATATLADQNSGVLAMLFAKKLVATGELNVKYKKPVKKGQIYVWSGQVKSRQDRKITVVSTVKEMETGTVCAEVQALMVTVNWEHRMGDVFRLLFQSEAIAERPHQQS